MPAVSSTHLVFTIKRLEILDGDSAIVAGEGLVKGKGDDGPYTFRYQSSNVLVKRAGRWQAVASHVSGVTKIER